MKRLYLHGSDTIYFLIIKMFIIFLPLSRSWSLQNNTDHDLRKNKEARYEAVVFWEHIGRIKMCSLLCSD